MNQSILAFESMHYNASLDPHGAIMREESGHRILNKHAAPRPTYMGSLYMISSLYQLPHQPPSLPHSVLHPNSLRDP